MGEARDDQAPDDVRYAMDETRARLSQTADQLGDALSARVGAVKDRVSEMRESVSVGELVQRHPWPALGLAVGLGVALAASGADTAAAGATTGAARRATRGAKDAVRRRRERSALERVDERSEPEGPGLIERLTDGILGAINIDGLLEQFRQASGEMRRDQPASVSTNRLAGKDFWKT